MNETMKKAIADRVAARAAKQEEQMANLINNDKFMDIQAELSILNSEIEKLDTIIIQ